MAIIDTDGIAEEHDHSDNCPGHPRCELRFAVRYSEYSSGEVRGDGASVAAEAVDRDPQIDELLRSR